MRAGEMDHGDRPTRGDVEAIKQWTSLGDSSPRDGAEVDRTYSEGRIVIPLDPLEAAREIEESAKAREQRHAEGRVKIMRSLGGALGLPHEQGLQERGRDIRGDIPR